jgi:membrane-associated phospholipid phosphatase
MCWKFADTELILLSKLNTPEKLLLAYFAYLAAAALVVSLDGRQRLVVMVVNCLIASVLLLVGHYGHEGRRGMLTTLRPWIPVFFILVAYRESGLLLTPDPSHRLDYIFIRLDDVILRDQGVLRILDWGAPWIQYYLELSYLLCYPIVPLGLATLYLAKDRAAWREEPGIGLHAGATPSTLEVIAREHFWTAVLIASLTCYFLFPFFPLAPPRELFNDVPGPRVAPLLRSMNHWLLGKYSVGASLFPSAHVAATTAAALAVHRYLPRLGWLFVGVAVSIALATVYGRYHYALDAIAGGIVGVSAFWVSCRLSKRGAAIRQRPGAEGEDPELELQ